MHSKHSDHDLIPATNQYPSQGRMGMTACTSVLLSSGRVVVDGLASTTGVIFIVESDSATADPTTPRPGVPRARIHGQKLWILKVNIFSQNFLSFIHIDSIPSANASPSSVSLGGSSVASFQLSPCPSIFGQDLRQSPTVAFSGCTRVHSVHCVVSIRIRLEDTLPHTTSGQSSPATHGNTT